MKIYNADPVTKEFTGESVAEPDQLNPGQWLIPAYSSTNAPGQAEAGFAYCLEGDAWAKVQDHRGAVYSTATGEQTYFGELGPLPDGLTSLVPENEFCVWGGSKWAHSDDLENKYYSEIVGVKRLAALNASDWYISRHRDEVDMASGTSLSAEQYSALLAYRKALRDITASAGYPKDMEWPHPPEGIDIEV